MHSVLCRTMKTIELKRGVKLKTKYKGLADEIRRKIQSNEYSQKLPGLRELAEEYDANINTIRKALELLRKEGLLSLKQGIGIFITGRNHYCIGIVGESEKDIFFEDRYHLPVFKSVLARIEEREDFFLYQRRINNLSHKQLFRENSVINGLLVFAPPDEDKNGLLELKKSGLPFIVIGTTYLREGINYVDSDNLADSKNGVEHLIKLGHKRIAYISNYSGSSTQVLRLGGYKDALNENKIGFDRSLVVVDDPNSKDFASKVEKLSISGTPTALFGANLRSTRKALEIFREQRNDLAVIVYDDHTNELRSLLSNYWVIAQPLAEIGRLAIEKLHELIEGKIKSPVKIKLKSELIFKESGGA